MINQKMHSIKKGLRKAIIPQKALILGISDQVMQELRKYYRIKGTPSEIYAALTNPFSVTLWTGGQAIMKEEPGTRFSLFDGDIEGVNLSFEKDSMIVQEWFFGDQPEKSIVTITLRPDRIYTKIELHHTNIPDEAYEDMAHGWDAYYFGGLKEFFER
jgi:activator of HSP90 ATPase